MPSPTNCIGVLISCASPAASWPTASSRWETRRSVARCLTSVMSESVPSTHRIVPSASRIARPMSRIERVLPSGWVISYSSVNPSSPEAATCSSSAARFGTSGPYAGASPMISANRALANSIGQVPPGARR